jgi:hypothetical protein
LNETRCPVISGTPSFPVVCDDLACSISDVRRNVCIKALHPLSSNYVFESDKCEDLLRHEVSTEIPRIFVCWFL